MFDCFVVFVDEFDCQFVFVGEVEIGGFVLIVKGVMVNDDGFGLMWYQMWYVFVDDWFVEDYVVQNVVDGVVG